MADIQKVCSENAQNAQQLLQEEIAMLLMGATSTGYVESTE